MTNNGPDPAVNAAFSDPTPPNTTLTSTITSTATPTTTVTPTPTPSRLPGDFNGDGFVDIRDYGVWRQQFGATDCGNPADANGDCLVDIRDYGIWRLHFGEGTPPAAPRRTPGSALLVAWSKNSSAHTVPSVWRARWLTSASGAR